VTPTPPLSLDGVFTEMKERSLANRSTIVRLTLFFAAISTLIAVASSGGAFGQAVSLGLSVLAGVAYTGMIIQLLCVQGKDREMLDLWRQVVPVLARLIWVTLLTAIMVGLGLLMFIVPGLILLTIWVVAVESIVVERTTVFESLRRSRELVRGNGWRVFLFLFLLALLALLAASFALIVAAPFGTGLLGAAVAAFALAVVVNPVVAIGPAALYNCLREDREVSAEDLPETAALDEFPEGIEARDAPEEPRS
jgi:hypothetical protein